MMLDSLIQNQIYNKQEWKEGQGWKVTSETCYRLIVPETFEVNKIGEG